MAEVGEAAARQSAAPEAARFPPIPARTQLMMVAWLRWRMFANGFRRQAANRKVGTLVVMILLRILLWPILAMWAVGPIAACGFLGYVIIAHHHPQQLATLMAGAAIFWQFVAINGLSIAATTQNFDPASLLRYPLRFGRYLVLRTAVGLLTPTSIIGCLALLAAAAGISIADPRLAIAALIVLGVYAAANIFFSRMVGAWLERWLAIRRFREIFSAVMGLSVFAVQFLNFRRSGVSHVRGASGNWVLAAAQSSGHALHWFPPGFAARAILDTGNIAVQLMEFAGLLAWTALFLAAFAFRLHKQFLGELLSESAPRSTPVRASRRTAAPASEESTAHLKPATTRKTFFSPILAACLRKEFLDLRGKSGQLMAMAMPLLFVLIFSRGILLQHPRYLLPGALAYALFGLLIALYNIFGADGAGVQLYLLAPVRLRDVVLAKNFANLAVLVTETILAWCLVMMVAKASIPASSQIASALWVIFVIAVNLTLGILRSIQAPRRFVPGQPRQVRASSSRTSSLLVLGVLFGSILLQLPITWVTRYYHQPWLAALIFLPLALAAVGAYALLLRKADDLILKSRDLFAEELCRV